MLAESERGREAGYGEKGEGEGGGWGALVSQMGERVRGVDGAEWSGHHSHSGVTHNRALIGCAQRQWLALH